MFGLLALKHIYIKTLLVCTGVDDSGSHVDAYHAGFGEEQRDVNEHLHFYFTQAISENALFSILGLVFSCIALAFYGHCARSRRREWSHDLARAGSP